jgi:transcriptional regulator with XRE-family HTH domain
MNSFSTYLSNPEILSLIGERIRQWRIKKEFTQNELTQRTGLSRGAIQKLESGTNVDLNTIIAIIRSLDLIENLNQLLPEPEPTIESLKEIQSTTEFRKRVRKKKHG